MTDLSDATVDELESFQHLHRWKVLQYNASEIRLSHCEELCLVMRLVPEGVDRLELTLLQGKETDELYRILRDFFFQRMKTIIEGEEGIYDGPAAVSRYTLTLSLPKFLI